jgi:hydrogenase maturation protease
MRKLLVAGVGNIFLGDDGFGVEVVKRLAQRRPLSENLQVMDFGIRSYDLAYALMEDWELVILVDALPLGGEPGTLYTMEPELPETGDPITLDAHSMNPVSVLQLVKALGGRVNRMLVVGCEPATLDLDEQGNIAMSVRVNAAIEPAIKIVEQLIANVCSEARAA